MSQDHSLLDRLLGVEETVASRTIGPDSDAVVESILSNLDRLLCSRHGAAPAQPEYGLPDIGAMRRNLSGSKAEIADVIRKSIETYEPRLTNVVVAEQEEDEPNPFSLNFTITAYLVGSRERKQFEAQIDNSGKIIVSA